MLLYSIQEGSSTEYSVRKTLYIEGDADSSQRIGLHSTLLDILISCDHLVVNIEKVRVLDGSFILLLCAVYQTMNLFNKNLEIQSTESGSVGSAFDIVPCPKSGHCLLEHCFLRREAAVSSIRK